MPTAQTREDRQREKRRRKIERRAVLANRKAFYLLAAVLLFGLIVFSWVV